MILKTLTLENYRNFSSKTIELDSRTALIGPNGIGKSNLIEAIRLLSVGKSFKTNRLEEVIQFDQPYFRLSSELTQPKHRLELFYGQPFTEAQTIEKRLTLDKQAKGVIELLGILPSVLFLPTDLEIVIGGPTARRQYLDGVVWQLYPEFRLNYLELGRVLRERSALLFLIKTNRADPKELQPWNHLLTNLAKNIRSHRQDYCQFLSDELPNNPLSNIGEIKLTYQPNTVSPEEVRNQEIKLAQNLVGPHRDELEIKVNNRLARSLVSRGQARALVTVLKILETKYLNQAGMSPVVLLDDLFSELDGQNSEQLFQLFELADQIIITNIDQNSLIKDWKTVDLAH